MKRMKALLGVVLAIAMVLSLSLTVFAAETIKVLNPVNQTGVTYNFLKIFDAYVDNGEIVYYTTHENWANKLNEDVETTNLILTHKDATTGTNALPERWEVTKTALYRASEFSSYLAGLDLFDETNHTLNASAISNYGFTAGEGVYNEDVADVMDGITVPGAGYYYIEYSNGTPYALTTVLEGATSAIENKHDMPFDKHVYKEAAMTNDIDYKSVQVGDTVYYKVTAKVPNMGDNTTYMMKIWDILGDGLELNSTDGAVAPATPQLDLLSIKIGDNEMKGDEVVRAGDDLVNPVENTPANAYWVNIDTTDPEYSETMPAFVVNFDLIDLGVSTGADIVITYSAKVTKSIGVVRNTAHLVAEDYNKDAQTQNYVNQIVVDKFETGNSEQKLAGAQFVLWRWQNGVEDGTKEYYVATYKDNDPTKEVTAIEWKTLAAGETAADVATIRTTNEEGATTFAGLTDGTYYLEELVAPTGYVRVETPIKVVVNGSASLDPTNTVDNNPTQTTANQNYYLSNVAQVANTPGSVLPSTGGRGTTMLYLAGMGMMLAAGAFLIFRRRAEAGK